MIVGLLVGVVLGIAIAIVRYRRRDAKAKAYAAWARPYEQIFTNGAYYRVKSTARWAFYVPQVGAVLSFTYQYYEPAERTWHYVFELGKQDCILVLPEDTARTCWQDYLEPA